MLKHTQIKVFDENDYANLIHGKTLAVVGPSQSVIGHGDGPLIDSCDLVIRFNYMFPMDGSLSQDIGHRTDILYHCFCRRTESENKSIEKLYDYNHMKELKCLVTSINSLPNQMQIRKEVLWATYVPSFSISDEYVEKMKEEYKIAKPTLGIVAIEHLLKLEPKSIFLTGFTAHKDNYYSGYNNNHPNYWKDDLGNSVVPKQIGPHDVNEQKRALQTLWNNNRNVLIIKDHLKEILK